MTSIQTQIQPYLESIVDSKVRAVLQSVTSVIEENQEKLHHLLEVNESLTTRIDDLTLNVVHLNEQIAEIHVLNTVLQEQIEALSNP